MNNAHNRSTKTCRHSVILQSLSLTFLTSVLMRSESSSLRLAALEMAAAIIDALPVT